MLVWYTFHGLPQSGDSCLIFVESDGETYVRVVPEEFP